MTGTAYDAKTNKWNVTFTMVLPAGAATLDERDNRFKLDYAAVAWTPTGEDAGDFVRRVDVALKPEAAAKAGTSALTFNCALQVPAGDYMLRVAVRDNLGGRVGSVNVPLHVK
jgi:hypothetical protein